MKCGILFWFDPSLLPYGMLCFSWRPVPCLYADVLVYSDFLKLRVSCTLVIWNPSFDVFYSVFGVAFRLELVLVLRVREGVAPLSAIPCVNFLVAVSQFYFLRLTICHCRIRA